jgi:hypothetical protein
MCSASSRRSALHGAGIGAILDYAAEAMSTPTTVQPHSLTF